MEYLLFILYDCFTITIAKSINSRPIWYIRFLVFMLFRFLEGLLTHFGCLILSVFDHSLCPTFVILYFFCFRVVTYIRSRCFAVSHFRCYPLPP